MSRRHEQPPGLLHNIGGPPRASIVWRGLSPTAADGNPSRTVARTPGVWLHLQLSIGQRDPRYHRDWNSVRALLELLEPGHGLAETAAAQRLVERIDAHTQHLDWPPCLLTGKAFAPSDRKFTLDHPLTAFVALSKSTGALWLRDRAPRLAPLHAPTLVEPSGTPMRGVRWDQCLWFPQGVPPGLIEQIGAQAEARKPRLSERPMPMGGHGSWRP